MQDIVSEYIVVRGDTEPRTIIINELLYGITCDLR